jgi:ABC-2 type transport system ATP-binding protein
MNAIETHDLVKYYDTLCAVDHLSLSVGNEVFGLLGPNGSGKTTTVLMLTTLLRPTSGRAEICGYDVQKEAEKVRNVISYVPQEMAVDIKLTGRENVVFFARLYGIPDPKDRADEALALMGLRERADDLTRTYSGGMRRRLELAQALVHEPSVLFLDEPTLGLDVAARKKIWEHIGFLSKRGMSIFVTTHYMDEADRFCDRVGIIDHGRIAACGTPAGLKARLVGNIVTVHVEGPCPLPDLAGVRYLGRNEDELSFTVERGKDALPGLADFFSGSNVLVRSMSLHEPTLDDVFLQVVGPQEEPHGFADARFRMMLRRRK